MRCFQFHFLFHSRLHYRLAIAISMHWLCNKRAQAAFESVQLTMFSVLWQLGNGGSAVQYSLLYTLPGEISSTNTWYLQFLTYNSLKLNTKFYLMTLKINTPMPAISRPRYALATITEYLSQENCPFHCKNAWFHAYANIIVIADWAKKQTLIDASRSQPLKVSWSVSAP